MYMMDDALRLLLIVMIFAEFLHLLYFLQHSFIQLYKVFYLFICYIQKVLRMKNIRMEHFYQLPIAEFHTHIRSSISCKEMNRTPSRSQISSSSFMVPSPKFRNFIISSLGYLTISDNMYTSFRNKIFFNRVVIGSSATSFSPSGTYTYPTSSNLSKHILLKCFFEYFSMNSDTLNPWTSEISLTPISFRSHSRLSVLHLLLDVFTSIIITFHLIFRRINHHDI